MKEKLSRLMEKLARFFWGRYGIDQLGYALIIAAMVLSMLSSLFGVILLMLPSYALLVWEIVRMMSKNTLRRSQENVKFLKLWAPVRKWFKLQYNRIRDFRTHRYFSCPHCKNNLRVPKGRGDITITCPVCKTRFDRRS